MNQNQDPQKAAMLKIIEQINKVEGFDPEPFAVELEDPETKEKRKRLPVMIQMAWFRMKYPEGKIAVHVNAARDCFVATARVYPSYKDSADSYLAEGSASRGACPEKPAISPREWAQTAAIGVALRNAGFGLQFQMAGEDFASQAPDEFDVEIPQQFLNGVQNNVYDGLMSEIPTTSPESTSVPTPESTPEPENYEVIPEPELSMTERVKLAMMQPCPLSKHPGKTLGEVLPIDPGAIKWVAEKYSGNPEIKEAAQLICEYAMAQQSA